MGASALARFAAVLVPLGLVIDAAVRGRRKAANDETEEDRKDLLALFLSRPATETQTTTREDVVDTRTFARWFAVLARCAVGDEGDRRLVVVIDNLDRITSEAARAAWSTLQVFVEDTSRSDVRRRAAWLVVPLAETAAEGLWASEESADQSAGQHMLSKTFRIRLDVPAIVPSDFSQYFCRQFVAALPAHSRDAQAVDRVYRAMRPHRAMRTPREVKRFINDIVVVHRERGGEVPLTSQAAYVVLRNEKEAIEDILKSDTDYGTLLGDAGWRRHVAALHFGVQPDVAVQTLLEDPITRALNDGDASALAGLADLPGFGSVLLEVVQARIADAPHDAVQGLIDAVALALELPRMDDPAAGAQLVRVVAEALRHCTQWIPKPEQTVHVLRLVPAALDPAACMRKLLRLLVEPANTASSAVVVSCIKDLMGGLGASLSRLIRDEFTMPSDAVRALDLLAAFGVPGRSLSREALVRGLDERAVDEAYRHLLTENGPDENEVFRLEVLVRAGLVSASSASEVVITRLRGPDASRLDELAPIARVYRAAVMLGARAREQQTELPGVALLSQWADLSVEENHSEAQSALLLMALEYGARGEPWSGWPVHGRSAELFSQLSDEGPADVPSTMTALVCSVRWEPGRVAVPDYSTYEQQTLERCLSECDLARLPVRWLLAARVVADADAHDERLAMALSSRLRLVAGYDFTLQLAAAYDAMLVQAPDGDGESVFDAFLTEGMKNHVSADVWLAALRDDLPLVRLLRRLRQRSSTIVGTSFAEAASRAAIDGSVSDGWDIGDLLVYAEANDRTLVRRHIAETLFGDSTANWRGAGEICARLMPYLEQSGFPWTVPATRVLPLLTGLTTTDRAREVDVLCGLLRIDSLAASLGKQARSKLRRRIRDEMKKRSMSSIRRQALESALELAT